MNFYLQICVIYLSVYLFYLFIFVTYICIKYSNWSIVLYRRWLKEVPGTNALIPWACREFSRQFLLLIFKTESNPCNLAAQWMREHRCFSRHITHGFIHHPLPQNASLNEYRKSPVVLLSSFSPPRCLLG